jgi:riboflavin biosynthesis pyrimidine reductase
MMQQVTVDRDLGELTRRIDQRIDGDIVIESGPSLLIALVDEGVVDEIEISISPIAGNGDFIDLAALLSQFTITSESTVDGTRLLKGRYKSDASNS